MKELIVALDTVILKSSKLLFTQATELQSGCRSIKSTEKKVPFPSKAKRIQRQLRWSVFGAHTYLVSFTGGRMDSGKETMVATSLLQHIWA